MPSSKRAACATPARWRTCLSAPIILISMEDHDAQARAAGANTFLRKPNNLVELLDNVRRLLPRK